MAPETAPTVTVNPVAEDSDGYFESIDVFLQYSAPVSVFTAGGTPALSLRFGNDTDTDVPGLYFGGSGSPRLLFRYVLPKPLGSPGTVRVVEDSLMARGGIIRYVGSDVDVPLAHGGAAAPPFVASPVEMVWSDEDGNGSFGDGDTIEVTLTFNEPVEVSTADGAPSVGLEFLNDEGVSLFGLFDSRPNAAYASGSGSAELVFSYTMTADDGSPPSIEAYGSALSLAGGSIKSVATTLDALLYFSSQSISAASTAQSNQRAAPVVVGVPALSEAGADGFWTAGETVEVQLTFSEPVSVETAGGTPSIGLRLGAQAQSAAYASGSPSDVPPPTSPNACASSATSISPKPKRSGSSWTTSRPTARPPSTTPCPHPRPGASSAAWSSTSPPSTPAGSTWWRSRSASRAANASTAGSPVATSSKPRSPPGSDSATTAPRASNGCSRRRKPDTN